VRWPWFVGAGIVAVAGFAAAWIYAAPRIAAVDVGMKRVPIPGNATVELDRPGTYTIYFEEQGGVGRNLRAPARLTVAVYKGGSDAPVQLAKPSYQESYTINGRAGTAIFVFAVERPGSYRVATAPPTGGNAPEAMLSIGLATFGSMFQIIGLAIAIVGVGLLIAFAIVFLAIRKQPKSKPA
jgi:hypothetical protein